MLVFENSVQTQHCSTISVIHNILVHGKPGAVSASDTCIRCHHNIGDNQYRLYLNVLILSNKCAPWSLWKLEPYKRSKIISPWKLYKRRSKVISPSKLLPIDQRSPPKQHEEPCSKQRDCIKIVTRYYSFLPCCNYNVSATRS